MAAVEERGRRMMDVFELLATLTVYLFAGIGWVSVVVLAIVLRIGAKDIFECQDRRRHDPHS
jgi:hypothetical protein